VWQLEHVLGQRQRRRPRLDPAKIDVNHVTGDENVSVVNRASGKRITGAKAPPIRYLKEWLLRNPEYDVDPKWSHIVKAKVSIGCILTSVIEKIVPQCGFIACEISWVGDSCKSYIFCKNCKNVVQNAK